MQKAAVADQRARVPVNHRERRRQTFALPAEEFFQDGSSLFARVAAGARKAHEVRIGEKFHQSLEIIFEKWL